MPLYRLTSFATAFACTMATSALAQDINPATTACQLLTAENIVEIVGKPAAIYETNDGVGDASNCFWEVPDVDGYVQVHFVRSSEPNTTPAMAQEGFDIYEKNKRKELQANEIRNVEGLGERAYLVNLADNPTAFIGIQLLSGTDMISIDTSKLSEELAIALAQKAVANKPGVD
ncbi:hypothetical protein G6N74_09200 [Mesorhizobium sp. CGMCC 1.15528]|uniref:DUF3558 domain-containing protein n=1 Tax=Mesorhizobium zhangyense TaxID=1776730 RepID=A0A7C9R6P6_9HYPH|nr:hypothetical protein [Mesorhizobium zhangyense]NGN41239.1 hypothetical protein [Mesorhizobium zhangyense]